MDTANLGGRGPLSNLVLGVASGPEDQIQAFNPVLHYTFDEPGVFTKAIDYGSGRRDGTINGTPTYQVRGPSDSAIQFNSSTDFIQSTGSALNQAVGSISLWFKVSQPGSTSLLMGFFDSSSVFDKTLTVSSTGLVTFTAFDTANRTVTIPAANISYGRWNHIVATFGSGISIFLNGGLIASGTCASTRATYANPNVYIGAPPSGTSFSALPGLYDEVAVFTTVLNAGQVQSLYLTGVNYAPQSNARVTNVAGEVARNSATAAARITQITGEVIRNSSVANARITQFAIETVRASAALHSPSNSQTLTFTQTVSTLVVPGSHPVSQTLSFTQTPLATVVHNRSINQTLTFTQSTAHSDLEHVSQTLSFTETVAAHKVISVHITDTLTFTQHVNRVFTPSITQTLTFTQTTLGFDVHAPHQTLAFTETLAVNHNSNRQFLQSLAFTQTVELGHVANLAVNQTLNFTQTAIAHVIRPRSVLQSLNFSETTSDYKTHPINQTLTFTETVTLHKTYHRTIAQSLVFSQTTSYVKFTPPADFGSATQTLLFDQTVSFHRIHNRSITQHLTFTETWHRGPNVFHRLIEQTLEFQEPTFKKQLAILGPDGTPLTYYLPVATITKVKPIVILQSQTSVIVLPTPEWDDSERGNSSINIKRSMNGKTRTYVKSSDRINLSYTFILGRIKSLELRYFIQQNLSSVLFLDNWKGERFIGTLNSNPTTFTTTGRYVGQFEKVSVTLEFQGIRLSG